MMQPVATTMLDEVVATTVSAGVGVNNAKRLSIMLLSSAVSSGNAVFTVQVSNDNINYATYNRITTNVVNAIGEGDVRVASVTLSTNTTNFMFFPPGDTFAFFRVTATRTTDGKYTAIAYAD